MGPSCNAGFFSIHTFYMIFPRDAKGFLLEKQGEKAQAMEEPTLWDGKSNPERTEQSSYCFLKHKSR